MTTASDFTEPGRSVGESGVILYAWPPEGRFADVWRRFLESFPTDEERIVLRSLIARWMDETSRLVAYTDDAGEWVDVTWPWEES